MTLPHPHLFSHRVRHLVFILLLLCTLVAQAAPMEVRTLLRIPDYAETQLSENGRYLAVLVPVNGRVNLSVIDLDTRKPLTRVEIPGADIQSIRWVGNEHLLFSMDRIGQAAVNRFNTGGLFLVSRDGQTRRKLFPTVQEWFATGARRYVYFNVVDIPPGQSGEVIVSANDLDEHSFDLYRLELATGKRTLLTPERPPRTRRWLLDGKQQPLVAEASAENSNDLTTYWRPNPGAPWKMLWRSNTTSGEMTVALHLENDGQLVVASNAGRDTMALYRYDPQSGTRKALLAEHPRFDVGADAQGELAGALVLDPGGNEVVGVRIEAGKPEAVWLDEGHQRLQALIDQALPGTANIFARPPEGSRTLVLSYADRKPARWHLLDEKTGQMEALFVANPWLDKGQLVAMQPFFVKTRDGLEILSYVFLPPGRKADEKLPTVLLLHGGPWTQSVQWGPYSGDFQEAQLLASRGYAVVVPNFRGTTGLGRKIYQSARGEFGRKMQDDIEDATDWAIKEGIADPGRICLSGASYGGYASLMGLVKTPDKYRCAIAGLPVTDLRLLMTSGWSDISRKDAPKRFWIDMVGDPDKQAAELDAVSPARQAQNIKGAVMLYGSVDDQRTPLEQMEVMRKALQTHGREPRWITKYGEGHGFGNIKTVLEIYQEKFEFLQQQIGTAAPQAR